MTQIKPTYTLHKLLQGYVLTSAERLTQSTQLTIYDLKYKLGVNVGDIKETLPVIAQHFDFSALSPEEQKRIGWFDVEKLALEEIQNISKKQFLSLGTLSNIGEGFLLGFQKAQELLLSQPKSWEVEVEMETLYLEEDSMNYTHEQDDVSGSKEFPKLTNGKAKVLRIVK